VAVLYDPEGAPEVALPIPKIPFPGLTQGIGELAARFYGAPSRKLSLIGITGTNGKTSCAYFLAQLLDGGYIGTLGFGSPERVTPTGYTTPPPILLQQILARFREEGKQAVALEVSSHALDQRRLEGCRFRIALWTNLSRDHLDYHGDFDRYAQTKRKLISWPGLEGVVLNGDDPKFPSFVRAASAPVTTFSLRPRGGDFWPERPGHSSRGLAFTLHTPEGTFEVSTPLFGELQLPNLLAVSAAAYCLGVPSEAVAQKMATLKAPPGRMERFGGRGCPTVVVDYAHTPDALERVLQTLRSHCGGRLWLVFGCGGERDRGKRAEMGKIAGRLADRVVLTDDNPRSEDPKAIVADILKGLPEPEAVIHDRESAILYALERASEGDLVLIAGKGHETFQQVGGERIPFSDREVVEAGLRSIRSRRLSWGKG